MLGQSYALDATWRTLLKDLGLPTADILRRAGLPEDLFLRPNARLPSPDYYRLWQAVEAHVTDTPMPIRIFDVIRAEAFSPLLFAAICSPNLIMALRRVAQYKPLIGPMAFTVTEGSDTIAVQFRWLDAPHVPPASLVLMELLFVVVLARMGTRTRVNPLLVTTSAGPSDLVHYQDFLGTALTPGNVHGVTFSMADATLPFLTENDHLWAAFEPELRLRLVDLEASATLTTRVRAVLNEAVPAGMLDMASVARRLGMSKRTLQRRMEQEGTSFQSVLTETREKLARHYLRNTRLPATEISFLLGFEEPNSFYKAFRRWTGATPDSLRRGERQAGRA